MKRLASVSLALSLSACAQSTPPPGPASAAPQGYAAPGSPPAPPPPPPAPTTSPRSYDGAAQTPQTDKDAPKADRPFAEPPADTADEKAPDFRTAATRFSEWAKALEASLGGSACDTACRALASMDRSAKVMCDLAHAPDEQARCNDAKARVREARGRVKRACGDCAADPSSP